MSASIRSSSSSQREAELLGQTVVATGGTAGIGLAPARRARAEGADGRRDPLRATRPIHRVIESTGVAAPADHITIDSALTGVTLRLLLMMVCCLVLVAVRPVNAQIRGQYESGLNATNSGTFAPPGLTYASVFQLYSFDQAKDSSGTTLPISGNLSVLFQHNFVNWTTESAKAGAMRYGFVVDIPISSNSLTIADLGSLSSGAGLTDIYIQPLTLGWNLERADIQVAYGFIALLAVTKAAQPTMLDRDIGAMTSHLARLST
jgi:hypothetical protein